MHEILSNLPKIGTKSILKKKSNVILRPATTPLTITRSNSTDIPKKRKPRLLYIQNPFQWIRNKFDMQLFRWAWDPTFNEVDFKRGVAQAVTVTTNYLRKKELKRIREITTKYGYNQISKDLIVSKNDPRLQLLIFRTEDIKKVVPLKIYFQQKSDDRHCFIDTFSVAVRMFDEMNVDEQNHIQPYLKKFILTKAQSSNVPYPNRAIIAEIVARFHKELGRNSNKEWNISYFKVSAFNVLCLM